MIRSTIIITISILIGLIEISLTNREMWNIDTMEINEAQTMDDDAVPFLAQSVDIPSVFRPREISLFEEKERKGKKVHDMSFEEKESKGGKVQNLSFEETKERKGRKVPDLSSEETKERKGSRIRGNMSLKKMKELHGRKIQGKSFEENKRKGRKLEDMSFEEKDRKGRKLEDMSLEESERKGRKVHNKVVGSISSHINAECFWSSCQNVIQIQYCPDGSHPVKAVHCVAGLGHSADILCCK